MNENTNFNYKRASYMALLKRKNYEMTKQINKYVLLNEKNKSDRQIELLLKLTKNISLCAFNSLYRVNENSSNCNNLDYIYSHTCKSKACQLCNWHRQKTLRKKYLRFFKKNEKLIILSNGKNQKVTTEDTLKRKLKSLENYTEIDRKDYDLMHLTLTLPHYKDTGFQGDKYYYGKITELFERLRKSTAFNHVLGGEYGIETTINKWFYNVVEKETGELKTISDKEFKKYKKEEKKKYEITDAIEDEKRSNGLNIHIHSLLFIERFTKNRNAVHGQILKEWNNLTYNQYNKEGDYILNFNSKLKSREQLLKKRITFEDLFKQIQVIETKLNENLSFSKQRLKTRVEKIMVSNCDLTENEVLQYLVKGATLIGFETIFSIIKGKKVRSTKFGDDAMLKAVMETISYHFEPQAFDKKYNRYDLDLLTDILPELHKKKLRGRFGALAYDPTIDMNSSYNAEEDLAEYKEEAGREENNKEFQHSEHFLINPLAIYHDDNEQKMKVSRATLDKSQNLNTDSTTEAILKMQDYRIQKVKKVAI